jgi:hypothetical protein
MEADESKSKVNGQLGLVPVGLDYRSVKTGENFPIQVPRIVTDSVWSEICELNGYAFSL